MILAIDAGNSRVKWGLWGDGAWLALGSLAHTEVVRLAEVGMSHGTPTAVVVSNVAGEKMRSALAVLCHRFRVTPVWATAQASQCGVENGYDIPGQLGSDRWAALVAARARCLSACLVVCSGTATTVDALSADGRFLGGLILPGLRLMSESLFSRTAGIAPESGHYVPFPTRTADAVFSGALQATVGSIERMHDLMIGAGHGEPHCLLSGGAARELAAPLTIPATVAEHLVLEGLVVIAAAQAT